MTETYYIPKYDFNLNIGTTKGIITHIEFTEDKILVPASDEFTMRLELFKALIKIFGYKSGLGTNVYKLLSADNLISFIGSNALLIEDIIHKFLNNYAETIYIEE